MAHSRGAGLAVLFLSGFASIAQAQADFPGGWSNAVGIKSFSTPGFAAAAAPFGIGAVSAGNLGIPANNRAPSGALTARFASGRGELASSSFGVGPGLRRADGMTANGMSPLVHSIRHAVK